MSDRIWLPKLDTEKCTGCGDCVTRCPVSALTLVDGKSTLVKPETCTYCTECEDVCPTGAIELPFLIVMPETREGDDPPERHAKM